MGTVSQHHIRSFQRRVTMRIIAFLITITGLTFSVYAAGNGTAVQGEKRSDVDDYVTRGAELELAGKSTAALQFYVQAAQDGSNEGAFRAGKLTWQAANADTGKAKLLKVDAGLRYLYRAATNRHAGACLSLAQAFREGGNLQRDLARAYACLIVAKNYDPSIPTATLDECVVELDAAALQKAQGMARRWLAAGWPERIAPEILQGDARLKIYGISRGSNTSVIINRKTFMAGDSASVLPVSEMQPGAKTNAASLDITCAAIGSDYVLVQVDGEKDVRLLQLTN